MLRENIHFVYTLNQSLHWFIVGLFFPIMVLIQLERGLSLLEVGTTTAIYSATIILLELPTGGLSDSIGRKRVYLLSIVAQLASYALILISWNFITVALAFLAFGVARALSSGSMDAWFVDEFNRSHPGENLQKSLAKVGAFIPLALGAASILGGILPMTLGPFFDDISGMDLYSGNLIIMIVLAVIQLIVTTALVKEHGDFSGRARDSLRRLPDVLSTSVKYGAKHPVIKILLLATVALGFSFAALELLWQPRVLEIVGPASDTWIFGLLAAGYFLMGALGNVISAAISDRIAGRLSITLMGLTLLMGASMFLLGIQVSILGFAAFYLIAFMFNGMGSSPHAAILNSQVPSEKRSTLLSFESLILQTGFMIGSLVMGALSESFSITTALIVAAVVLASSSIFYLILHGKERSGEIDSNRAS